MAIITISRGSFSGGKMLAECAAKRLKYRCIDREEIIQKAAKWGVSEEDLRVAIEKPPSFFGQSQHTKYLYLTFIQATLAREVCAGNVIYHGLAGHLLLPGGLPVLRVRVIAPMEFRIAKVQERLKYDTKQAVAYVEKMDRDRRKWTRFLYGVDWEDPSLYDIVIDIAQIDPDAACELICSMARLTRFEFTPQSQKAMQDLVKASHVKAELARNPATWDFQFDVSVQNGSVCVKGDIVDPDQARIVASVARAVTGVQGVDLEKLVLATRF